MQNEEDKNTITKFMNDLSTLKGSCNMLRKDMEDIIKENKEMQQRIEAFEEEKFGMRTCQNCHEKFSPLKNEEVLLPSSTNSHTYAIAQLSVSSRQAQVLLLQVQSLSLLIRLTML